MHDVKHGSGGVTQELIVSKLELTGNQRQENIKADHGATSAINIHQIIATTLLNRLKSVLYK